MDATYLVQMINSIKDNELGNIFVDWYQRGILVGTTFWPAIDDIQVDLERLMDMATEGTLAIQQEIPTAVIGPDFRLILGRLSPHDLAVVNQINRYLNTLYIDYDYANHDGGHHGIFATTLSTLKVLYEGWALLKKDPEYSVDLLTHLSPYISDLPGNMSLDNAFLTALAVEKANQGSIEAYFAARIKNYDAQHAK